MHLHWYCPFYLYMDIYQNLYLKTWKAVVCGLSLLMFVNSYTNI